MDTPVLTPDILLVLLVTGITVLLFITEWLRADLTALVVMTSLPLMGLVDGKTTFSGLSSTAVISIIAVLIIGRGLDQTGVINRALKPLMRFAANSRSRILILLSSSVAVISSFMQNVGAAALFLPAIQRISRQAGIPISQLLMPVGFSAILGGTITLVGSSPLIMLNDLLEPLGLPPFGLFSVTPIGAALVITGILYFILFGRFVLPKDCVSDADTDGAACPSPLIYYPELVQAYELSSPPDNEHQPMIQDLCDRYNVHTVILSPDGGKRRIMPPDREIRIPPGSALAAWASPEHIRQAADDMGFIIHSEIKIFETELAPEISGVAEAIVSPHSSFIGKRFMDIRFRHTHLMAPLAIMHNREIQYTQLSSMMLEAGDVILMHARWEHFQRLRPSRDLVFVQPPNQEILHPEKALWSLGGFLLATTLVIFSSFPISICLMTGAVSMLLTRVLSIDEAYQAVDWRTVFLLSGLIPLGAAMQNSGAAAWMAHHILSVLGTPPPLVFLLVIGAMTTILTLIISNVGATVLLVPLAADMAIEIGLDPRMAALMVGLAASNAFLLPTHQVNALYMGPGGYASTDYLKSGSWLSLLFLLVLSGMMGFVYDISFF